MASMSSSVASSFEPGPDASDASDAKWVPDTEVTECICGRRFGLVVRRHHCRSCGKVVCGKCSDNHVPLKGKMERVCNACADTLQYDQSGQIALKRSDTAQREAALKADLKRTLEENEWCRGFLLNLSMNVVARKGGFTASPDRSEANSAAGGSPFCTPPSTPGSSFHDAGAQLEQERIISQGKSRWEDVRFDYRTSREAVSRLHAEVEELTRELRLGERDRTGLLKKTSAELKTMEEVLSREGNKQQELSDLRLRTASLETQLEGITQRMQALESGRSAPGSPNISFRNMSVMSASSPGTEQRCSDRCRERCAIQ